MKNAVISLGGSLIVPDGIDIAFLRKFSSFILSREERFIIICGGGKTARAYQDALRSIIGSKDDMLDWIGIYATKLNAFLLRSILGEEAEEGIVSDPTKDIAWKRKVLVASGWKPGRSTDYDAVLLAKKFRISTIINMSNVNYVYNSDPAKNKAAEPLKELKWSGLRKIIGDKWSPGLNMPFDPIAAIKAEKLGLKAAIIGSNISNLKALLDGNKFIGTVIS